MYKSVAVVFPGQGSQSVGMLSDIAEVYPQIENSFKLASDVLGYDLWSLVQDGPDKQLNITEHTQPALLVSSIAIWNLLYADKLPKVVAGHSLGEYSALVASGVLAFEDAVSIVRYRGRFMQEAVPEGEGAVAAILGLSDSKIIDICEQVAQDNPAESVSGVNFNAPGQVVIAGHVVAVRSALSLAKEEGAKRTVVLPISVPVHCKLMQPAATALQDKLQGIEFKEPQIPVLQNVTCQLEVDPAKIKHNLVQQLVQPVEWVRLIKYISAMDIDLILECGPGKVLSSLNKRINPSIENVSVGTLGQLNDFVE